MHRREAVLRAASFRRFSGTARLGMDEVRGKLRKTNCSKVPELLLGLSVESVNRERMFSALATK
jgi:hypothetical protein